MHFNKFTSLPIFVLGVAVVFALIASRGFFHLLPAYGSTSDLTVFDDQLQNAFANWSWNSSIDFNQTSSVFSGSKAIRFAPSSWGALYLHTDTAIDTTQYASLQFALQSTDPDSNISLLFYDSNNQQIQSATTALSHYANTSQNGWKIYTIPLNNLFGQIKGFALQETSGNGGAVIYIDSITFVAKQTPTPTLMQTATSEAASYPIYTDSLNGGWVSWSWNSSVNFSNNAPVSQGSAAIAFTPTSGYGGLYVHNDSGVVTSPYTSLTFSAKASSDGQAYAVGMYDANNQLLHPGISLDSYGGQPTTGQWKTYTIPLADLNASNKTIKGISFYDITGQTKGTVYIDTISLIGGQQNSITAGASATPTITAAPQNIMQTTILPQSGNPLSGLPFYNDTDDNPAATQIQMWQSTRPTDAAMIDKIASQPKAIWMGNWISNIQTTVQTIINKAMLSHTLPVFVAYNIPNRDCGSYSAGGSGSAQAYQSWIDAFATGIGPNKAVIILEPDALAQITCLSSADQQTRLTLLSYAVKKFKSLGSTAVYMDAGNGGWIASSDMASRLMQGGLSLADGFSINVSNFVTTADSIAYGKQISALVQNKHFVIDTSRNGNGPTADSSWCNPPGRALGLKPTSQTNDSMVDAYLWIKYPGESDGTCNGGPAAGVWYPDYALQLAQNAHW